MAAPADVVISEIMYSPLSDLDGDEFLEIANPGTTPVDISGWCFGGITLCFPAGTSMAAGAFLVVSPDAAQFQSTYGRTANFVYTGGLKNGGETITLKDAASALIDTVTYTDRDLWPTTADGLGPSIELIDATLNNDDSLNWASSTAASGSTPGAANSVRGTGLKPRITAVGATPTTPAANQAVTVTATITGQTSQTLRFRTDFGTEQGAPMTTTGGGVYTGTIPGAAAGHLLRYRVEATNSAGTNRWPRADDSSPNAGVTVASGINSSIPVLEWFIADADYNAITANPTQDITRSAVLAYKGQVFDNTLVNIRGQGTQTSAKPNWKFEMPKNHDLTLFAPDGTTPLTVDPVDEFAMQADYSDSSHGRPILAWDSYSTAGVVNAQLFPVRTQKNAQFQGLYTYLDLFDGTWRDREGYSDDQFFKAGHSAFDASKTLEEYRFEKKNPNDTDFSTIRAFLDGVDLNGTAQKNHLLASADIPNLINYAVVTAVVQHTDSSTKNFYLSQDVDTGRWEIIPWDLDHTYGNTCCKVNSNMVTPAEPGDQASELMTALLAVPEWKAMYFRRLRTVVNQVLAPGRLEAVYDAKVGPAAPEFALDFAKWRAGQGKTYANQRTALFNALQARRNAFANDSRVPGNQSAAPSIVINEIQHTPTAGNGAEFVELYNPSTTEAVDLSGWSISSGIDLTIQPGTVILPRGTMTFVSDDPTFRATYGTSAFVGGVFDSGDLLPGESLTLNRADGSTADSVTFGGAGWPDGSSGRSLELTNPSSDNNDGANWANSVAAGGSPGAPNGGTVVNNPPGAPTIGNATAGNASATVRWTAPGSDGGSAITGYQVRVVDSGNAQVGALRPAGAAATSLVVTGLTNGSAYRFQVSATNSAGPGAYSAFSNAVTPTAGAGVPGAPIIAAPTRGAAGGAITAVAHWRPPTSTGGSAITGYRVTALRMSSSAANATVLSSTDSPILGSGIRQRSFTLTAGNYRFEVVAINAVGTGPASARSANVVPR